MPAPTTPFKYGVAGYPEKHDEAMNLDTDIEHLKAKVAMGADHIVTQMFFDNAKYCTMLPRTFHIDFPQELAREFTKCKSNDDVKALGIEWGRHQVSELQAAGVPIIHFYTMNAAYSTERILK